MNIEDFMNALNGRKGRLIFYKSREAWHVRRSAIPGKKRVCETNERSTKQQEAMMRFAAVQAFYKTYCLLVSPVIWKTAARSREMPPQNLFFSRNYECFDGKGALIDFERLEFSEGKLFLPRNMKVNRDGEYFRVTWEEEREWERASPGDRLRVGVIYDSLPLSPRMAAEVRGTRGEREGSFRLNANMGMRAHVYLFFERVEGEEFSESNYFRVE